MCKLLGALPQNKLLGALPQVPHVQAIGSITTGTPCASYWEHYHRYPMCKLLRALPLPPGWDAAEARWHSGHCTRLSIGCLVMR